MILYSRRSLTRIIIIKGLLIPNIKIQTIHILLLMSSGTNILRIFLIFLYLFVSFWLNGQGIKDWHRPFYSQYKMVVNNVYQMDIIFWRPLSIWLFCRLQLRSFWKLRGILAFGSCSRVNNEIPLSSLLSTAIPPFLPVDS